jgi:arsenate reductase
MEVWYNPSCSKCRIATEALDEAGVTYTLRRYLDDPPTAAEIEQALDALGLQPWDITRLGEPLAKELGLAALAVATGCAQDMPAETPNLSTPGPPLPPVSSAPSSPATVPTTPPASPTG